MRARPTIYEGIRMRSRLEAAYAEELDNDEWVESWEYEPCAYASSEGQYLPDFAVEYTWGKVFSEVKPPNADFDAALARMHVIYDSEPGVLLTVATRASQHSPFQWVRSCWNNPGVLCLPCRAESCEKCGAPRDGRTTQRTERWGTFQDHECSNCHWTVSARVPAVPMNQGGSTYAAHNHS